MVAKSQPRKNTLAAARIQELSKGREKAKSVVWHVPVHFEQFWGHFDREAYIAAHVLVTKGFVSTGYQAHSSQGSLRTLCGTPCTWDVVCGGIPAVPGVSFCSFRLFWMSGLRLLLCICKFGESFSWRQKA